MDELVLDNGVPIEVTPTKASMTIQNTMPSSDDFLMVSSHGDVDKKWMKVLSGGAVKFGEATYFMQTGRASWVFPVIESD